MPLTVDELNDLCPEGYRVVRNVQDGDIRIVVLQRGWVVVGRLYTQDDQCELTSAYVVRRWGTTHGLGELAECGPLENTKLDSAPSGMRFHRLTVVCEFLCNQDRWSEQCK